MAQASRDQNNVPTLLAVSNADGSTPIAVYANPTTHRLLVDLAGGSGTVTSVSVVTANGFAGTVANATTTPAITLTTSVTGILKGNGTAMSAAVEGTDYVTASSTNTFTNKTYDTAGTGNSFSINGTAITAVTGTGSVVLATSPTLVTPLLGTPTSGTLTNCTGLPISSGVSGLGTGVATFLATPSSANLASALTDETGTGVVVFSDTPTFTTRINTPALRATGAGGIEIQNSSGTQTALFGAGPSTGVTINGTLNVSSASADYHQFAGGTGSITDTATGSSTNIDINLVPKGTGRLQAGGVNVPTISSTDTLTNKTLTTPTINGATLNGDMQVDATPNTDDTFNGISTNSLNAGATVAQWEAVYLDGSSTWQLTDADAASTSGSVMVALATEAGTSTNPLRVLLQGFARNDAWTWTVGGPIYLSTTAGALTQTAPSGTDDVVRVVGFAVNADVIYWNPSADYITRT